MEKYVYVITRPECGWDCVVAVLSADNYSSEEEVIADYINMNDISEEHAEDYIAHFKELQ